MSIIKCGRCGQMISDNMQRCAFCGWEVSKSGAPGLEEYPADPEDPTDDILSLLGLNPSAEPSRNDSSGDEEEAFVRVEYPDGRIELLRTSAWLAAELGDLPAKNEDARPGESRPDGFIIADGTVTDYQGNDTSPVIPDDVTSIGNEAFRNRKKLMAVTLPNGVREIGEYAFDNCTALESVVLPDGVREIGKCAFNSCIGMVYAVIPASVEKIGEYAFDNCPDLTIVCRENSYVHRYCADNHYPYLFDYQFEAFNGVIPSGIEKLNSPFLADEEKPYIFVSYSHRDRDEVLRIIKLLYESGWKIWYDEGLTIGDRYDETLESHVKNCAAVLLFATTNSFGSSYIRENELPWAARYDKPVIQCVLDEGAEHELGENAETVSEEGIEPALERVSGLVKGERRVARGILVAVDPSAREMESGGNFAYCLYTERNSAVAQTVLFEARSSACAVYDAVENGADEEKLRRCACLIVFLERAFLSDPSMMRILTDAWTAGRDIAVLQTEALADEDLPRELAGLHKVQWLNIAEGITADVYTKLVRHLQKQGCRNDAVLPGFEYDKTAEGIVIRKYTGMDANPKIENRYGGIPVIEIADEAFDRCAYLKSVSLPAELRKIGRAAFSKCARLTSIVIPDSVTRIGEDVFRECGSLISAVIGRGVKVIPESAFIHCRDLESVTLSDGTEKIGDYAFCWCERLKTIRIPDSLTHIGEHAFEHCGRLTSIAVPQGVAEIGRYAFASCSRMTSVVLPDGLEELCSNTFESCMALTSVNIPKHLRKIGWAVFNGCRSLSSVTIPEEVTEICESAFSSCENITSVVIPRSVTVIGNWAFSCCKNLTSVEIGEGVRKIGEHAFFYCALTSVKIPDGVTEIGKSAFCDNTDLTLVEIGSSVKMIGEDVFENCENVTVLCPSGSYARQYCIEHGIKYRSGRSPFWKLFKK